MPKFERGKHRKQCGSGSSLRQCLPAIVRQIKHDNSLRQRLPAVVRQIKHGLLHSVQRQPAVVDSGDEGSCRGSCHGRVVRDDPRRQQPADDTDVVAEQPAACEAGSSFKR